VEASNPDIIQASDFEAEQLQRHRRLLRHAIVRGPSAQHRYIVTAASSSSSFSSSSFVSVVVATAHITIRRMIIRTIRVVVESCDAGILVVSQRGKIGRNGSKCICTNTSRHGHDLVLFSRRRPSSAAKCVCVHHLEYSTELVVGLAFSKDHFGQTRALRSAMINASVALDRLRHCGGEAKSSDI
jgi:hypothetical protein